MVTLEIPNSYALSAPTTPHLTINHDVAQDLDSTNAFEGPEKLLEVWFAPSPSSLPPGARPNGLKAVPSANWVEMLDMVNCKILSVVESDTVDAYLLSESSMFVFPHKIILKTCGTTTLLLGLYRLLRIAAVDGGFPVHNAASLEDVKAAATPHRVFYSRKNFLFPDRQQGPHRSWKQEVKYLDDLFEGGSAYMHGLPTFKRRVDCVPGYRRMDRIVHDFDDYDLIFRYYERDGWVGDGVARVGEDD
ncbi:adenosylmethionine decarboxylase [Magnaporthiopsis poae ATCC 64411]|uniref:Adenosylmethionine decarboxylase n=1 Tax=Magnaporthiopsis poae (strain ATCC 64411 / 73-15) TaxID=644358 RepID=A0A0C4EAY7_MAGP6|nr:adenosylmethionine decarboxylase [Magnaporthiopsis poae ATCC 64411]